MRYNVVYDQQAKSWAVVDSRMPGFVVGLHPDLEAARDAAWHEEERWYKVHPFTPRPRSSDRITHIR